MNGLNAGNDSVNRGSDGLNALLMQRFGADGNEQGGRAAQLAVGGASFRSMLKDRMTNTATESNAGDGRRNAAETERTATGGRVASRSMNHGAAVSAARADSRRTTAADNGKSHGGPVAGTVDDAGNTEAESTREETAGASEDKTGMAQVDVRNGNGRLKIKVKSQDAGEALSAIVAAMLEAIRAAAGETAAETGETVDAAEASGVTAQASTTEGTATTDAAALLKTLEGLLAQVGASATEADGTGDADGFLERLTALLEKAGVGADALKSLSIKFTTDDGSKLMLKLQSLAAGWKNALGGEGTT